MVATTANLDGGLSDQRSAYAGPVGAKGLVANAHVFAIAVFASMGGLIYGCKNESKSGISSLLLKDV